MIQNRATRPFAAMLIALVAFAVLASPILTAYAAAPVNAISYQGRLLDTSGNPVSDASAEFVFRFFGSEAGADCLWESDDGTDCDAGDETQTVAINDGLFSENIGSTVDPDGLSVSYPEDLAGVFENSTDVYLEVVINGETLSPRKQIVAAPFALNSQSLDGLDSTDFLASAGDTATGVFDFTGATMFGSTALSFDGGTAGDGFETSFAFVDPSADRTVIFQNGSGTVAFTSDIPAGSTLWESDATSTFEDDANVFIGSDTLGAVEAAFVPNGDDLYVAGDIAAQFDIYADKFVAGDASTTFEDGAITTAGATDLALSIAGGDLTFGQNTVIGDGGDALSINTSDWDISAAGDMTNIGSIAADGLITANGGIASSAATSLSIVSGTTGTITLDSGTTGTVNIGTGASGKAINVGTDNTVGDAIAVGSPNDTLDMFGTISLNGPVLVNGDLESTGGNATFQGVMTANGDVTMNDALADTIAIGAASDTVTIASDALSLTDDDWSIEASGAASFASVTLGALPSTILMTDGAGTIIAATAGTDYLTGALADNNVLIGNGAGVATAVTLSGDVTSTNLGVLTIGSGTVDGDKILNDAVDWADIADATTLDADTSIATAGFALSTTGLGALTFSSTGQVSFAGNVNATSGLDVTGASLTVGGANFSVDPANGNTVVGGTLGVTGVATFSASPIVQTAIGTDDQITFVPNAGGAARFAGSITSSDLTGARSWSFPNVSGTVALSGTSYQQGGNAFGAAATLGTTDANTLSLFANNVTALTIDTLGNTTFASGKNVAITGAGTFATGTGTTTVNSTSLVLAGNSTVVDMTGTGTLGLNTTTNRAITTGSGLLTAGGSATITGTLTANGTVALGDNGDTVAINSSDWDVDASGAMTGIATVSSDENQTFLFANIPVTGTDATSHSVGLQIDGNSAILVTATGNGSGGVLDRIVDIGRSGGTDTVNIGDATSSVVIGAVGADVSVTDTQWSVTAAGVASFASMSLGGNLNMANNLILNVGNANTDFTAGGGLTIADDLSVGGTVPSSSPFGVDESANTVYIGEGSGGNGTLTFKASDGDTGSVAYSTGDRWEYMGGDVFIGGTILGSVNSGFSPSGDDLYVEGDIAAQLKMYADSFTAGDASTTFADGSVTTGGTTDLSLSIAGGDLTFAQNTTIGDGGDSLSINSSDWDIDASGNMTDIDAITAGGLVTFTGGLTMNDAGADTILIGAAADTVTVVSNTLSLTDDNWNISAIGASNFASIGVATAGTGAFTSLAASSMSLSGNINLANNLILNVGNPGTDFNASGGLTLFDDLAVNGGDLTSTSGAFNLLNTGVSTLTIGGAATILNLGMNGVAVAMNIGNGTGGNTITVGNGDNTLAQTINIASGLSGANSTVNILSGNATAGTQTLNLLTGTRAGVLNLGTGAVANVIGIGSTSGTMTLAGNASSTIDFGNFDVAANGNIAVGIGRGLDVNAAGTLNLGSTNATTINIGAGGALARSFFVGTGTGIDNFTIDNEATAADIINLAIGGGTNTVNVGTGTGADAINIGNGTGSDVLSIGNAAGTMTLTSGTGKIDFAEFDVSETTGSVTIDDVGGNVGALSVEGTILDINSLDFIGTGIMTAASGSMIFDIAGAADELTLSSAGALTAIGGATFGDGTGIDTFTFTTIATAADAMTLTADSLTTGTGLSILRSNDAGSNFTNLSGLLNVSMLDTDSASTGPVSKFINAGSGSSVFIDANGNTGGTVSDAVGGALHITNSGNTGYGLSVYSNQNGSSTSGALSKFHAANTGWDGYVMEIESGATDAGSANGSALHIIQNDINTPAPNEAGTQAIVIDITKANPATITGDLDDAVLIIRSSAGLGDTKFRIDYDGDVWADGHYAGVAFDAGLASDVAEKYPSAESLVPGELVAFDAAGTGILRSTSPYQSSVTGIISTEPGVLLASDTVGYKMALTGRVPTNVSDENGSIQIGDPIASSSIPGHGMKATEPGMIVGFALEDYSETGPGSISVFVSPQFYVGSVIATDGSATVVSDTLALGATGTADATSTAFNSNAFELRGSAWDGAAAQNVQMSMATDVTNASDYRLSIKNTAGSEIAYVSQAGDMALSGRLYPSDRGTLQTSKYIYYDGSSGSGGDFMRTNASGWATGSYDFAEMFPSVDALEAGDVVMFGTTNESVLKSTGSSANLAGIVSTRPGFLAGENMAGHFPIALAGRVPTKVSFENGSIAIGDPLTASATNGYAMKAVESGPIVGYALEAYSGAAGTDDKIIAFVNAGYWAGGPVSPTPGTSNAASTIIVRQDADNLTALNMEGNVYMAGNDILGVGRIAGLSDRWSLEEDGTIKTAAAFKTVIESYQGEMVETTAVTSPDVQITLVGSATLENGEAVIRFEDASPSFNDVTSTVAPIRVVVTPNGPVSLYVYEKNNDGFGVRQMNGSDSGITFDWMVSAYRKDYEPTLVAETVVQESEAEETIIDPVVEEIVIEPITDVVVEEPIVVDPVVEEIVPVDEPILTDDSSESNLSEPILETAG